MPYKNLYKCPNCGNYYSVFKHRCPTCKGSA